MKETAMEKITVGKLKEMIPHLPFWTEDDEDNAIVMYNRYGIDIEKEIFDAILEAEKEDAKKELKEAEEELAEFEGKKAVVISGC